MIPIAEVGVRFVADPGSLLSSAKQVGAAAGTQAGESFGSAFNEAGKRLLAGFVGAEAILKTVEFVRSSLDVAREAQVAWSRLSTTLEANVKGWDGNTDAIKRQIDAAEKLGFKESDVVASITPLVGATKSVTEAINVQNVAMDLARYTGHSLQEATDTLTKFEAGRFRGLAQLGVQIDAHATKEQALAAVEAIAHGQREAYARQDASAQDRLDAAFERLQIEIGTKLLPAFTGFTNFLTNSVVPGVGVVVDNMDKFAPLIEGIALALTAKLVGGFVAARLSALGFGAALVETGAITVTEGTVIEGTAIGAADAWKTAIATILVLPEVMNVVGDAYENVRKTIFGSNPVIQQWTGLVKGASDAATGNADVLAAQKAAQDALTAALTDGTGATGKNTDSLNTNTGAAGGNSYAQTELTGTALDAAAAAEDHRLRLDGETAGLDATGRAASAAGGALAAFSSIHPDSNVGPLSAEAAALDHVAYAAAVAARNLAALSSAQSAANAANNARLRALGEAPGAGISGSLQHGFVEVAPFDIQIAPFDPGLPGIDPVHRGGGGGHGGSGHGGSASTAAATAATQALAATTRTDLTAAFNAAKASADALFAGIRDKSIASAQTVHDTLVKQIGTDLKNAYNAAERAANEAKRAWDSEKAGFFTQANADQQAFALHQVDEQRAQLVQSQSDAANALQQNTDPAQVDQLTRAYSQATQALADFSEEQRIAGEQADAQKRADALDASHQAIDPVTGAATTDIDLALAKAKSAADAIAMQKTTAADADLKRAKTAADNLYTQQSKDFDAALALVQKHLVDVKGAHSKAIAEIDALYVKFGISAKKHGANIAIGLADGLRSETKAVEKAAESLAAAVNKYIVTHSPAEAGPWAVDPPSASGARAGRQFAAAMAREVAPALLALTQGGTGLFAAPDVFRGLAATAGPAQGFAGAAERAGHQLHFTINNPAPERAGQSATRTLQLIADQLDG